MCKNFLSVVKEFNIKNTKMYKTCLKEIPAVKNETSSFKLIVESFELPDWVESQYIYFELFADKKFSYWLDSSKVSLKIQIFLFH